MAIELHARQKFAHMLLGEAQRHTCLVGGARSGKTTLFTRAICLRAIRAANSRHAILRFRANAARSSIALDTLPRVMRAWWPDVKLTEHRQDGYFSFPNGSQIWIGGLDEKERVEKILGQEFVTMFFNECSQIPYASVLIALTRLAQNIQNMTQRAYYDLNPVGRGHWTNLLFGEFRDPVSRQPLARPEDYRRTFINPEDNRANLPAAFLQSLADLPLRQRKRFYEGEYVDEIDGALWTYEGIEQCRVENYPVEKCKRIVVAIDPSGAKSVDDTRDEIGIVVAALGEDGHGYVLEDVSLRDSPAVWGKVAVNAYHRWKADGIIAEQNFGGEMVRFVINAADPNVSVRVITASRGKAVRAEPVSALYEKGKVHHVGRFPVLEDQLCAFSASGYLGENSPDHADALVWAISDLMVEMQEGYAIFEFYQREADKVRANRREMSQSSDHHFTTLVPGKGNANAAVLLKSPEGYSNISGGNGRSYLIGADRTVLVHADDVHSLTALGFVRVTENA